MGSNGRENTMSHAEEYYQRANTASRLLFNAGLDALIQSLSDQDDKEVGRLEAEWEKTHGSPPVDAIVQFWYMRGVYAMYWALKSRFDKTVLRTDGYSRVPDKGTEARRAWDAAKKQTALRKRKAKT